MTSQYLEEASKKIQAVLDDYNVSVEKRIIFPRYKILPPEVQLALSVIQNHGVELTMVLKLKEQKK